MKPIVLQNKIIYGPVESRRLGRSLGLNILPTGFKLCSMDCCYCQYGWSNLVVENGEAKKTLFPSVTDIVMALRERLLVSRAFDYITFSGNGEPTLHPEFPRLVDMVLELKAFFGSDARLAILSNSTNCHKPQIRKALQKIDLPILKLDAGNQRTFQRINEARGRSLSLVVDGIRGLTRYAIQTMFVTGAVDNSSDAEVHSWIEQLKTLTPEFVQVYSLDRNPAHPGLVPVSRSRLQSIASRVQRETGIPCEFY